MKISGQLTATDYIKARQMDARSGRITDLVLLVLLALGVIALEPYFGTSIPQGGLALIWRGTWPVLAIAGVALLYYLVVLPWRVRRTYEDDGEMLTSFGYEITPGGLSLSHAPEQAIRPWRDFMKWDENEDLFLLYPKGAEFIVIPKRYCSTEQAGKLRTYLKASKIPHGRESKRSRFIAIGIFVAILIIMLAVLVSLRFWKAYP